MSNSLLQIFEGTEIRIVENKDGEFWWVAADVCRAIEIKDVSQAVGRLEEDEKGTYNVRTLGGNQGLLTVSEAGLYSLIFSSSKPAAKRFKRWVLHEVIPSIRKTGSYSVPGQEPAIEEPTQAPSSLEHLRECIELMVASGTDEDPTLKALFSQRMAEHLGGKADVSNVYTRSEPSPQQPTPSRQPRDPKLVSLSDRAMKLGLGKLRHQDACGLGLEVKRRGFTSGARETKNYYQSSPELDRAIVEYIRGRESHRAARRSPEPQQFNFWGTN